MTTSRQPTTFPHTHTQHSTQLLTTPAMASELSPLLPPPVPLLSHDPPLSPPPVPFRLPPPLYRSNPLLWSQINDHLWSTCGLLHRERAILGAVFQHLPTPIPLPDHPPTASPSPVVKESSLIDRLLLLSVKHLKLLASLFSVALLHARAWGGPRSSTSRATPAISSSISLANSLPASPAIEGTDTPNSFAIYEPLFTALDIPSLPDARSLRRQVPVSSTAASSTSAPARSAKQKDDCLKRHLNRCPISLKSSTVEHAHIIPHSVVALANKNISPFWMMLGVCLGPTLRDSVFSILANSYATTNSIVLDNSLHKLLDNGTLHLAPVGRPDAIFEPSSCTQYDIRFTWWGSAAELRLFLTTVHLSPDDQVRPAAGRTAPSGSRVPLEHVRSGPPRFINDGDHFRLFTNDPVKYPLPHPLLLDLHGMLWRMLSTAGMAEYKTGMKRRLTAATASAGSYDDDDDNDDDDAPGRPSSGPQSRGGRDNPRTAPKRRKNGDGGYGTGAPPTAPPPPADTKQHPVAPVEHVLFGSPDSFDLKWVDFRLDVLAAERERYGENWQLAERAEKGWMNGCEYSSDNGESSYGSEYSDQEENRHSG